MAAAAAAAASSLFSEATDNQTMAPAYSSSVPSVSDCSHRGFRGMFKVPSLVFDIELEDNGIGGQWQEDDWEEDEVITEIQRFIQPSSQAEARLVSDVRVACSHAKDGQDTTRLLSILSALGYKCSLRTALGGGDGADCLRNLRHTFITCETPASLGTPTRRYIVDAQFKEQFIIAKTTARYASILAAIPQVFVGPEEHLMLLVNFLCNEMSTAFRQLGSVLPPWRHASSMMSKWRPRKSIDESLASARAAAAAASGNGVSGIAMAPGAAGLRLGLGHIAAVTGAGGASFLGGMESSAAAGVVGGPFQWQCNPYPAPVPLQPHNHQVKQWQQAALAQQQFGAGAVPISAGRRPSYEPQRVVLGGNFVPIIPSPAPAS